MCIYKHTHTSLLNPARTCPIEAIGNGSVPHKDQTPVSIWLCRIKNLNRLLHCKNNSNVGKLFFPSFFPVDCSTYKQDLLKLNMPKLLSLFLFLKCLFKRFWCGEEIWLPYELDYSFRASSQFRLLSRYRPRHGCGDSFIYHPAQKWLNSRPKCWTKTISREHPKRHVTQRVTSDGSLVVLLTSKLSA